MSSKPQPRHTRSWSPIMQPKEPTSMLELVLPTVLDHFLVHGWLIVSVSSFLIMLASFQPLLLPGGTAASRGVCSASRAVLVRLLSGGRSDGDGDGGGVAVAVAVAPPPPPPRPSRRSRHCCERCAASSWPDAVAAVTASLRLDDDDDDEEEDDTAGACGGCAAMAAVDDLLERKEASEQELRQAFYVFDRDDDGFVGAGELWNVLRRLGIPQQLLPDEGCCARMIAAHDGDGDGRISFPEFRAMMERAA